MTPSTPSIQRPPIPARERNTAGSVVPFRTAPARRLRRDEAADAPRGQILLFTGVRYERLPEVDAPAVPQRRRK
ncbi:hypothetical protein [Methylobacterium sp. Leaf118]|uniref:hypothetical protein n=1 Tax=Methylobacterium sp. Leaf118 TaxID=2876562 RepID=UPI001E627A1E|nr:hypothetical protein [Methylobacterium sp. Leaf118]